MAIREFELKLTASGPDGSAAAAEISTQSVTGLIQAVHVEYSGGTPPTADVVVNGEGPPDIPILTVNNKADSGWYYPRAGAHTMNGADLTYDGTYPVAVPIPLAGNTIKVTVNEANNGDEITVTIRYDDVSS